MTTAELLCEAGIRTPNTEAEKWHALTMAVLNLGKIQGHTAAYISLAEAFKDSSQRFKKVFDEAKNDAEREQARGSLGILVKFIEIVVGQKDAMIKAHDDAMAEVKRIGLN